MHPQRKNTERRGNDGRMESEENQNTGFPRFPPPLEIAPAIPTFPPRLRLSAPLKTQTERSSPRLILYPKFRLILR